MERSAKASADNENRIGASKYRRTFAKEARLLLLALNYHFYFSFFSLS
jgi:hypothetical protein